MTHGFGKKISAAIFFVTLCAGNFLVKHEAVVAAGNDCCIYTVDSGKNPPKWLSDLGDGAMWFESGTVGKPCKKPSEITALAQKKIDQFYEYNSGNAIPGSCGNTGEYKTFSDAVLNTGCCEITNNTGVLRSCTPIDKAEALKSETFSSCLVASYKQFLDVPNGDKMIAHKTECTSVASCQALQQKIDTIKADNKTAVDNALAQQKAAADAAAITASGKRTPWTKAECVGVKQKGSNEQQFDWIPPQSDLNVQVGDYCYIKQLPTKMQVDIGSTGIISGLPQYINIAYKYALGIGVIVMIVVIVFSGIQWMLSGVVSSINNSKDRIKNAALGLLLLFGANTILYTINPQLLNMKLPPMHAIRPEKFEVAATGNEGDRCDPGEANACAAKGPNFKCKPTGYYVSSKCVSQANGFMALVLGGAAIAAAGPFIISAATAGVAQQGAGQIARKVALEVAENVAIDAATGGQTSAAQNTAEAAISASGGKGKLILGGIAVITGLAIADNLYSDYKEGQEPANGYCVEMKHDLPDHSVCQADGDCASDKCLITSAGACGAGKYGVCVSGKLRQSCVIPKNFQKNLIEFLSVGAGVGVGTGTADIEAVENKYGCKEGSCVNNGRGASLDGVGVCSDGSDLGMACDDKTPCNSSVKKLACIKGYCRESDFFSGTFGTTGLWYDHSGSANQPRCLMPTDCNDASLGKFQSLQGTIMVGCLKNPSPSLNLPGRLLISQVNQPIGSGFYAELSTYGRCVTDKPFWSVHKDKTDGGSPVIQKLPFACFVNVYPESSFDSSTNNKKVADYLNTKNLGLSGSYTNGFKIQKVGCGCAKASSKGYGNDTCSGTQGACTISLGALANAQSQFANNKFISVQGVCDDAKGSAKLDIFTVNKQELLYVSDEDVWNNGIRFPNIIDVQYTNAGAAQGAGN